MSSSKCSILHDPDSSWLRMTRPVAAPVPGNMLLELLPESLLDLSPRRANTLMPMLAIPPVPVLGAEKRAVLIPCNVSAV